MENEFKYLIRSKDYPDSYLQNSGADSYSLDVGTAIHDKLPHYFSEKGDFTYEVIRSDSLEFKEILKNELIGNGRTTGLVGQIDNLQWKLGIKIKNRDLILKTLGEV